MSAKSINKNLDKIAVSIWDQSLGILEGAVEEGVSNAKAYAPWTDRTSVARNSISGKVVPASDSATGYIGIGVSYGKYLELANGGKYRIVLPTLFAVQNYLNSTLRNISLKKGL